VAGLDDLVTGWRGQRWIDLPGGIRGQRRYGKLLLVGSNREGAGGRE
jgi:tRNA(Ile)-lysidine synthase